jgi:hypothetical protein
VLGELGEAAMVFRGEKASLDGEFANGDFERLEVADFLNHRRRWFVPVAVVVIVVV